MFLKLYLAGLILIILVAFKMLIKYEMFDGSEIDSENIINISMLSLIVGGFWPIAIIGFIVYTISDNYANYLNANKK